MTSGKGRVVKDSRETSESEVLDRLAESERKKKRTGLATNSSEVRSCCWSKKKRKRVQKGRERKRTSETNRKDQRDIAEHGPRKPLRKKTSARPRSETISIGELKTGGTRTTQCPCANIRLAANENAITNRKKLITHKKKKKGVKGGERRTGFRLLAVSEQL